MFLLLMTALTYFYFHWQYFSLAADLKKLPRQRIGLIFLSFIVNYLYFVVCSLMEFPLIINWIFFAFLLFFETLLLNERDNRCARFSTLMGIIYGLSVNIFCRSVIAIVMNQPLQSFDNHTRSVENLKGIPVLLGFFLVGIVMRSMRNSALLERLRLIVAHPDHQSFLLQIMTGLFFYLFLNLLLYATPENNLLLKIWSIKSCLFSVVGFYIAIWYTRRICELDDYQNKNREIKQQLERQRLEEERLRQKTVLDAMTGLYNRHHAEETIACLMEQKKNFVLCFLDMDGLKLVNDQYGHDEGDRYILTVTEQIRSACRSSEDLLFRYGGDEFLILFEGIAVKKAEARAQSINAKLCSLTEEGAFPYLLSLSYGVVESTSYSDWRKLINFADQKMYAQKQKKRKARSECPTIQ